MDTSAISASLISAGYATAALANYRAERSASTDEGVATHEEALV
jgi:hypothetical protein